MIARRWLASFGRFLWDFLVGDTPGVTVGVLALVGITLALAHQQVAAVVVLPAVAVTILTLSALAGSRR